MTNETDRSGEKSPTDSSGPQGDFYRGGAATTTASRQAINSSHSVGTPSLLFAVGAFVPGLFLAAIVAWTTWTNPSYGTAISVLAGVAVIVATAIAMKVGWALGVEH